MHLFQKLLGSKILSFHFIGIGGIGMSGLALLLKQLNYEVQGSDKNYNANCKKLEKIGIKIFYNHDAKNIKNVNCIVFSSSIKLDNCEIIEAKKQNLLIAHRFDLIQILCRSHFSILISGSNGKTTTTSMVSEIMNYFDMQHSLLLGGIVPKINSNVIFNKDSKYCVAEICESDGRFTKLTPDIAVISNIDSDHLDFYKDIDNIIHHFGKFISNIPFYGGLVFCMDNEILNNIANIKQNINKVSYSVTNKQANLFAYNISYSQNIVFDLDINYKDKQYNIKQITLPVTGLCNLYNCLGAIGVALLLDLDMNKIHSGFAQFLPVKRRFNTLGSYLQAKVIDDYAHHPSKISAALNMARHVLSKQGKLIVIFEPHKYSRIKYLKQKFALALSIADIIFVTPVFSAGEVFDKNHNSITFVKYMTENINKDLIQYVDTLSDLKEKSAQIVKKDDILLFCGAGSITKWAQEIIEDKDKLH